MKYQYIFIFMVALGIFGLAENSRAAILYVDQTLTSDCTSGNYSTANRNCSGSEGKAYNTPQKAVDAMVKGDHILLRGGHYYLTQEIVLSASKNGDSWQEGHYNLLASYPGEWAILDGQGNIPAEYRGAVIGGVGFNATVLNYWKFERLEIMGGGGPATNQAYGFWASVGPFWFRYCYIHDNYFRCTPENCPGNEQNANSSGGIGGLCGHWWQDSIVEYCYFERNGAYGNYWLYTPDSGEPFWRDGETEHNNGHINIFSDYKYQSIPFDGFDPNINNGYHNMRNTYRYNYFEGARTAVAIKHKAGQYFTGQTESTLTDEYNTFGDKIHHNIFFGSRYAPIELTQDFAQVYNNIVDLSEATSGVLLSATSAYRPYKVVSYNNTILGNALGSRLLFRRIADQEGLISRYYGYDYNNIIDGAVDTSGQADISILQYGYATGEVDYSNYIGNRNYFYRPSGTTAQKSYVYSIPGSETSAVPSVYYTVESYMSQYPSKIVWNNDYNAGNLLYKGTSGADKYKTYGSHVISGSTTIANGGIGGSHPYLSDITIPSYIGAVNPSDNDWVDGVMSLATVSNLQNAGSGNPTWVEGSVPSDATAPDSPVGLSVS